MDALKITHRPAPLIVGSSACQGLPTPHPAGVVDDRLISLVHEPRRTSKIVAQLIWRMSVSSGKVALAAFAAALARSSDLLVTP